MSVYAWIGLVVVVILAAVLMAMLVSALMRPKNPIRIEPARIFASSDPIDEIGDAAVKMQAAAARAGSRRWAHKVVDRRADRFAQEIAADFAPFPTLPPSATSAQSGTPPITNP